MKKLIVSITAFLLVMTLTACQTDNTSSDQPEPDENTQQEPDENTQEEPDEMITITVSSNLETAQPLVQPESTVLIDSEVEIATNHVEDYTFEHWLNIDTSEIFTTNITHTFIAEKSLNLKAVYHEEIKWAQGITDDTIYVGNTAVTEGFFGYIGQPFVAGMEAYFDMINRNGGVCGRHIELVHENGDIFDGNEHLRAAYRLIEEHEVFALVGQFGTPIVLWEDEFNYLGIPRIYYETSTTYVSNENARGGERASFPFQPTYDLEGRMMVARAHTYFEATKIGLIHSNNNVGIEMKAGVEAEAAKHGIEIVSVSAGYDDDYLEEALSMIEAEVDIIILGMNPLSAQSALLALLAQGNQQPVLTASTKNYPSFIDSVYDVLEQFDVYTTSWINWFDETGDNDNEAYLLFQAEIDEAYLNDMVAMKGWIAAMTFVEAMSRFNDEDIITWEAFIDNMEAELFDYALGSPVDFSDGKRLGTQTMSLLQLQRSNDVSYYEVVAPFQHIDDLAD